MEPNVPVVRLSALLARAAEDQRLADVGAPDDAPREHDCMAGEIIAAALTARPGIIGASAMGSYEDPGSWCCSDAEQAAIAVDPFRGGRFLQDSRGRRMWTTPGQRRQIADQLGRRDGQAGPNGVLNGAGRGPVPRIR